MSLISLPVEILYLILAEIREKGTLLSLISTCTSLRVQVEPRLYEDITLRYRTSDYAGKFLHLARLLHETIVTRNSPHASRVHSLALVAYGGPAYLDMSIAVQLFDQILERLCNLKFLWFSASKRSADSQEWHFFPCLTRSPPPFQLKRIVWDYTIHMEAGFYRFLSQQHSVTDLTLFPHSDSTFEVALPSSTLSHLQSISGFIDSLQAFSLNHITAFKRLISENPYRTHPPHVVRAIMSLRAVSCPTLLDVMGVLGVRSTIGAAPPVLANLEFIEIKRSQFLSNAGIDPSRFSRIPLRYLRLPSFSSPISSFNPHLLFSRLPTLECIDCVDGSDYDPKAVHIDELLRLDETPSRPMICSRWRRGASSSTLITLPPRPLDQWELDLQQTE